MALIIRDNSAPGVPPVPPVTAFPLPPAAAVRIDGRNLVVPVRYNLPDVCVVTGETTDLVRVRRSMSWHPPLIALTIFLGLILYLVLAGIMQKRAQISFCISRAERSRRRKWQLANWGVFLMTFITLVIAGTTNVSAIFWLSPVCFIASLVIYYKQVRYLYPASIDNQVAELRGIAPEVMTGIAAGSYPAAT